jgi:glycosyltransferase involved in cell wall biosynthesis
MGGAQLHQHMLAQQVSRNHRVKVISLWDNNRTDWLLGTTLLAPSRRKDYCIDSIDVHRIGLSWWDKLRMLPWVPVYYPLMRPAIDGIAQRFERHIDAYAAPSDLIHNVRIGREPLSYASLYIARRYDIPFVFTPVHHPRWIGWRYQAYIELYKKADVVLALTEVEKKTLVELGVASERIFVTGIGPILADEAHPKKFLDQYGIDGPMILFLGQHYPYKGYQQLLEAASLVWNKVPEAQFVFIGPAVGNSERYFQRYQDSRIHRLGKVELQEKTDALAACTLLCVPSTQESFGGVYTEAWSFGKPVIGCGIPAVAEVIANGVNGWLVVQERYPIAERICDLLLHTSRATAMGKAGKHKVERRYSWDAIADLTLSAYKTAL